MGYSSTVKNGVRKAFNSVGDLVQLVTLTKKSVTGYDFATNVVAATTAPPLVIKGILTEKKRMPGKEAPLSKQMQFLFNAEDFNEPATYDTITTTTGDVWYVVLPYTNDGYLVTVNVTKEL